MIHLTHQLRKISEIENFIFCYREVQIKNGVFTQLH